MKQQPERQRGLDREIRVTSLRASAATSTRNPTANRILAEPDCDVSAIPEPLLVLRPVLDRILGLVRRGYETGRTCCPWISSCESSVDRQVSTAISSASSKIHAPTPLNVTMPRRRRDIDGALVHKSKLTGRIPTEGASPTHGVRVRPAHGGHRLEYVAREQCLGRSPARCLGSQAIADHRLVSDKRVLNAGLLLVA